MRKADLYKLLDEAAAEFPTLEKKIEFYFCLEMPFQAYQYWCKLYSKEKMSENSKKYLRDILILSYKEEEVPEIISKIEQKKMKISELYCKLQK